MAFEKFEDFLEASVFDDLSQISEKTLHIDADNGLKIRFNRNLGGLYRMEESYNWESDGLMERRISVQIV